MKELVFVRGKEAFTNSLVVAENTGNQHKNILELIRKYEEKFNRWGKMRFPRLKSENPLGGRPTVVAELNEQQATFLVTLLRNNDVVLDFKAELVDQFYKMRELIRRKSDADYVEARNASRLGWKPLTDAIQKLVELAHEQGSKTESKMFYMTYAKLLNKLLEINPNSRDDLEAWQNHELEKMQFMLKCIISGEVVKKTPYKQIYIDAKQALENYSRLSFINQRFITA